MASRKNPQLRNNSSYWGVRGELTVNHGFLFKVERLVITSSLRTDILEKIHEGHLGITKCRERAKSTVWWPGLSTQIADIVKICHKCAESGNVQREPLIQIVGSDLLYFQGATY